MDMMYDNFNAINENNTRVNNSPVTSPLNGNPNHISFQ